MMLNCRRPSYCQAYWVRLRLEVRLVVWLRLWWLPSGVRNASPPSCGSCHQRQDSIAIAKKIARCAQYMGALKSFECPHYAPGYCSRNFNGLLFWSILRMCVQNLKFVALSVPEIIGGSQKIWAVPVYAHAPFSPKFLIGFCSHGPSEYICQIWRS